jgi:hypothetical protein
LQIHPAPFVKNPGETISFILIEKSQKSKEKAKQFMSISYADFALCLRRPLRFYFP